MTPRHLDHLAGAGWLGLDRIERDWLKRQPPQLIRQVAPIESGGDERGLSQNLAKPQAHG